MIYGILLGEYVLCVGNKKAGRSWYWFKYHWNMWSQQVYKKWFGNLPQWNFDDISIGLCGAMQTYTLI